MTWTPPKDWLRITTIDAHTAGEPLRVITAGFPPLPGDTILAKRRHARVYFDHLRTALMWEPRGHADMYGCLVTEPVTPDGTLGVLFLHNEGFSTMCGHGVIGLAKVALDTGLVEIAGDQPVIRMDTPAGRVTAFARREGGRVVEVSFHNVPSFVYALDQEVTVPGVGRLRYDVAFGGAFYAFCRAEDLGVSLAPADFGRLIELGMRLKRAVMDSLSISHPFEEDLGFLYGTIIVGPAHQPGHHSRNVCIFADGEVDRCPTGTGVSARAALHHARGELAVGQPFVVESILDTCFTGEVVEVTRFGDYPAVIPQVTGTAHITGRNEWLLDPADPLRHGFLLR
ncbi:MAG: proline racemase family protein [Chloroflexi bacterium]|nr:proline racemase family protein [Chloroflexota bacterium]MCI0576744.1 proline racemase family protein [Chloroflexota bacterium]MCI0645994.1 proline racemase family protein [Chloroflexota bacterium]MCI0726857.1 proline racemase family protein [Chloroflexota bacterium]